MQRIIHDLVSPDATSALAQGVASVLCTGDVVLLEGEMGTGKTTFTRSLVQALGGDAALVASPTFVVVHVYPLRAQTRRIERVTHVDAYRLTGADDLEALGWDRLFTQTGAAAPGSVALVEWPSRIADQLGTRDACAQLMFEHLREDVRRVTLDVPDHWKTRPGVDLLISRGPSVCPKTRQWVSPTAAAYPFADERARSSDLFGWLTEQYRTSREARGEDQQG